MVRNSFSFDVIIAESGTIQIESLNQKSVGNVTTHFYLKIQQNSPRCALLRMQFQLLRN